MAPITSKRIGLIATVCALRGRAVRFQFVFSDIARIMNMPWRAFFRPVKASFAPRGSFLCALEGRSFQDRRRTFCLESVPPSRLSPSILTARTTKRFGAVPMKWNG
jgi:hypothetical protein